MRGMLEAGQDLALLEEPAPRLAALQAVLQSLTATCCSNWPSTRSAR